MSNKIDITFNGEASTIDEDITVASFLAEQSLSNGRFIVVINDEIVTSSAYDNTTIQAGDALDTIAPITGG